MLNLIWNRANKASRIARMNLYNAMRHSFGCQRLNEGFSLDEIRRVYSHTTSKTTERYAAYQLQTLEDIIRGRGYKKVILSQDIQIPENANINFMGGKDSNLG